MQMKPIGITSIVAMCIAGSVLGCTWVPLTDAGGSVRIVEAGAADRLAALLAGSLGAGLLVHLCSQL